MKAAIIIFATSLTALSYCQKNGGSTNFSQRTDANINVRPQADVANNSNTNTNTTTTHQTTTTNYSTNYSNTNTTNNNDNTWNNNNNNNNNWNNNNNNWNNNNNNWNNNNNNWNNNNNGWGTNNNSYNSNNGSYSNLSNTNQSSYKVKDDDYGTQVVGEDKTAVIKKACPYNTTDMMSNYRNTTPIDRFFKNNQKTSQVFVINAQQQNTLKGTGGTIIKIAPNSFVNKNGEVVKGDVEFELKEVYDRSSMITSNAHTVCNDVPLISGGEMYMGASQGDEPLMLAANSPVAVEIPAQAGTTEPMQLFYGKPDRNTVNWNLANNNSVTPVLNANSSTGYSYNFSSNSMNWINCDRFIRNSNASTKVNVRVPSQYDTTNTAVFIVFTGQNTVTKFDHFTRLDQVNVNQYPSAFDTRWYSVPVGSDVTIVALSEINGQYYSSMQRTVLAKDHTADLILQPTTLEQFNQDLEKLP